MKGVGAESGVKAEAIVFSDYSKDFLHPRQGGLAALAKFRRGRKILRRHGAVLRQKNPIFLASRGKSS